MRLFLLACFSLFSCYSFAQPCSAPGRTPETGIAVCGTLVFPQAFVPNCTGPDLPYSGCADRSSTSNSVWYKFHCYQAGTLGFLISPASSADDYVWQVMDITGRQPADVLTTNLSISVNLSGITGNTGCTPTGTLNMHCAGGSNGSQFNQMPNLVAGHDYLLMVTNWSASGLGYNLSFTGGTAVLTDNQAPKITNVRPAGCNTSLLNVSFSEDLLCSSLSTAGTEFSITNGTHVITAVNSVCNTGNNAFTQLQIALQDPLTPGNYQLVINNGTDANTLLDVCETELVAGSSFPFTIVAQSPLTITNVNYAVCAPTTVVVRFSKPVLCSSISSTGSEFSLSGNTVLSASPACNPSGIYADSLLLQLQNPLPYGNYQLMINAGSDANTFMDTCGVLLPAGTAVPFIINQTTIAPAIQSVNFDECKPFQLLVNFDKAFTCSSLTATGSEFTLQPSSLTVTNASPVCDANGLTKQILLSFSGNLPAGTFDLLLNAGSDGNTLSDSCLVFIPVNTIFPFTSTQSPAPVYDSVQYDRCAPAQIKVFYSKPILCSSVAPSANEFSITGPAPVSIISVNGDVTCGIGYTGWLTLTLAQPITQFGNYVLHNIAGADGNSVMDTCYATQKTTETISFAVLGKPSAIFNDQVKLGCVKDTIVVSHPGGNGINSWQWNFSDGSTASGATASSIFPASTSTATVQLIVSNGICSDTLLRSYPLGNAFSVAFSKSADTACVKAPISFTNTSTGNNLQYQWTFGDASAFAGQSPAPHVYTANGNYTITLIGTNNLGCKDTAAQPVVVTAAPSVHFTGLHAKYCSGEQVNLTAQITGSVEAYTWTNGNAVSLQNQPNANFSYASQGNYAIILAAQDRFCGNVSDTGIAIVYQVPVFTLGDDKTFCPGLSGIIGVPPQPGVSYVWSTGERTAQITTGPASNTYLLTADNNGCVGTDDIYVKVLDNCLIKVAGAFTPNGDGLNDYLRAINAELATHFSLIVFNRFGEKIFATNDPLKGWDGRYKGVDAPTGTYVWILSFKHPVTGVQVNDKGISILIR